MPVPQAIRTWCSHRVGSLDGGPVRVGEKGSSTRGIHLSSFRGTARRRAASCLATSPLSALGWGVFGAKRREYPCCPVVGLGMIRQRPL